MSSRWFWRWLLCAALELFERREKKKGKKENWGVLGIQWWERFFPSSSPRQGLLSVFASFFDLFSTSPADAVHRRNVSTEKPRSSAEFQWVDSSTSSVDYAEMPVCEERPEYLIEKKYFEKNKPRICRASERKKGKLDMSTCKRTQMKVSSGVIISWLLPLFSFFLFITMDESKCLIIIIIIVGDSTCCCCCRRRPKTSCILLTYVLAHTFCTIERTM